MFDKPLADMKIVVFGAGAVGATVGGWLSGHDENLYFLDQGSVAEALKQKGITLYPGDEPGKTEQVQVNVVENTDDIKDADIIIVSVKNYSLDGVAQAIKAVTGDNPIIISMANGLENVIFCVVSYNAWVDEPAVVGYQTKGTLIFGTPDNTLLEEMNALNPDNS